MSALDFIFNIVGSLITVIPGIFSNVLNEVFPLFVRLDKS